MIREATGADLPFIRDLHLASWRDAYRGMLTDAYLDGPVAEDMAARWAALPDPAVVLVAPDGFACCLLVEPIPYLDNLHAAPGARRTGIGRALMARMASVLLERGERAMNLTVIDANRRARLFYRAMGGAEGEPFEAEEGGDLILVRRVTWDEDALRTLASLDAPEPQP